MSKKVYLIRHGQTEANAANNYSDSSKTYFDTVLTNLGREQALNTKMKLKNIDFDLAICSPLTRTLHTFSIVFPQLVSKSIVMPLVRERLEHSSDVGRQPEYLVNEFPNFDFSKINNYWWNNDCPIDEKTVNLESIKDLDLRVSKFISWIKNRDEQTIAVISHGTYISRIINIFLDNCEFDVWHPDNG